MQHFNSASRPRLPRLSVTVNPQSLFFLMSPPLFPDVICQSLADSLSGSMKALHSNRETFLLDFLTLDFFEPMSGSLADTLENEFSPRRLLGTLTGSHMTFLIPSCLHQGLFDPLVSKPITRFCFLSFIIFSHKIPLTQSSPSLAWNETSNEPENKPFFHLLKPAVNMMASVSLSGGTSRAPTDFGIGA